MKKLILILFLLMFFISSVYACQYKINETYKEIELGLYDSAGNYAGTPLNFSNFSGGYQNIGGCGPFSLMVSNPFSFDITTEINFTARHDGRMGYPEEDYFVSRVITINAFSSEQIVGNCPLVGGSRLLEDSIKYVIISPELLISKMQEVTKQREICKICPNEKQCLDDNSQCSLDNECGTGICNIAGFCGNNKIVPCESYGKLNCKNQTCLIPSTKKVGEVYQCDFECKYGGKNGKCLENPELIKQREDARKKNWIYWLIGVFIIIILITIVIKYIIKKRLLTPEINELEKKIAGLGMQFEQKEKSIKELEEKGADLNDLIEENEKLIKIEKNRINSITEIISLKERELKNVKGEIRKRTEEELRKLRNKRENITKENILLKQANDKREEELKRKEDLAIKKYGGKEKVFVNNSGYIQFNSDLTNRKKAGKVYHDWIYIDKLGIGANQQIHHINGEKLNNEMWNLIAIDEEVHKYKVKEAKIKNEGWKFGLNYLLDNGFIKRENLHKYILEHLKNQK